MIKKIVILLVIFSLIPLAFGASAQVTDQSDNTTDKAVTVLGFLKIIDINTFDGGKTATRGEFVKASIKEYGLDDMAKVSPASGFSDVSEEFDGYVSIAKSLGFISGYDNNTFNPESPITYGQAIKITVSMLGYKIAAENNGGYPMGYLKIANQNKLLSNVVAKDVNAEITLQTMATILYNALEVNLLEQSDYSTMLNYEVSDNTLLESKLKVTKAKGLVTANSVTGLDSPKAASDEGSVKILSNSVSDTYETGDSGIENMLGYSVTYYYCKDNVTEDNVVLGYLISDNNEILEIEAKNILEISAGQISYNETANGAEKKATFPVGIRIIYNGRVAVGEEHNINLLNIKQGKLKFISSSGEDYDTVFVTAYQNAMLSGITEDKIYFSKNNNVPSQFEIDEFDSIKLIKDNKTIQIADAVKNWVASVSVSLDGKVATILFSDASATGKINEIKSDGDLKTITIDKSEYSIAFDSTENIKIGDEATYLLNAFEEVFCVSDTVVSEYKYAYVIDKNKNGNIEQNYQLKVFEQSGSIMILTLANNVSLSDDNLSAGDAYAAVKQYSLIQYQNNSDKLVRKIKTAVDYTGVLDYKGYDENNFSKDNPVQSMYYKTTQIPSFGGLYLAPSSTIVFNIPSDKTDEDNYMVTDTSIFLGDVFYNVELYDSNKQRQVKSIVNYGIDLTSSADASLPWNSSIFVVNSMKSVNDENRGVVNVITGYQDGKPLTLIPAMTNNTQFPDLGDVVMEDPTDHNSLLFSQLTKGNVIQFKLNAKKEVDSFRCLYNDNSSLEIRSWNGSTYAINLLTAVAMVSYIDDTALCITIDDNSSNSAVSSRVFAIPKSLNVYVYDKAAYKVSIGSMKDIVSMDNSFMGADKVFLRSYRDSVNEIVILRGLN